MQPMASPQEMASKKPKSDPKKEPEYRLRKYLLLLATVAATLTYSAAFSPPGGLWQQTDAAAGHLAGDPIIRDTHRRRYLVFFYCNATAFASSLVVIVLILLLSALREDDWKSNTLMTLRTVVVLDLLSLLSAYAAGTCRDRITTVYSSLAVVAVFVYLVVQLRLRRRADKAPEGDEGNTPVAASPGAVAPAPAQSPAPGVEAAAKREVKPLGPRRRKVLMLLATFAISVTYVSGLTTPGGFWDGSQAGRRAGDAILEDYNRGRLVTFFIGNTTAFVASLGIVLLLLDPRLISRMGMAGVSSWDWERGTVGLYGCIIVALVGLVVAYAAGSCRDAKTTAYVLVIVALLLGYMGFHAVIAEHYGDKFLIWMREISTCSCLIKAREGNGAADGKKDDEEAVNNKDEEEAMDKDEEEDVKNKQGAVTVTNKQEPEAARSLVLLLGTLAASVTYQAGLHPPGGVWQDDGNGHLAGDPILMSASPRRYKAFYYCNSTAFVASLAAIVLVRWPFAHRHHTLEVAMILDLFGLIGAYAAGSCQDVSTSIYTVALAGGVVIYVVIHVVFFTLDQRETITIARVDDPEKRLVIGSHGDDDLVDKRRKRLLMFAILAATISYQAGLTPPGGFWPDDDVRLGHRAGEPVLRSNYPRRYSAFFYSNSLSFMSAVAHIVLLVNPNLYRPAIRSFALSVSTAAGMLGLMAAYAAGSTQHLRTSIYVFVLAFLVFVSLAVLLVVAATGAAAKDPSNDASRTQGRSGDASRTEGPSGGASRTEGRSDDAACSRTEGRSDDASSRTDGRSGDIEDASTTENGDERKRKEEKEKEKEKEKKEKDKEKKEKEEHAKSKYLMLLGILMASVTYAAGLDPPGGVWQADGDGHAAGDPVLLTNRRVRYLIFFLCNSASFVESVLAVVLLLPEWLKNNEWWLALTNINIVIKLLSLLGAHAAGSSRGGWKTSVYAVALAALGFAAVYAFMSCYDRVMEWLKPEARTPASQAQASSEVPIQICHECHLTLHALTGGPQPAVPRARSDCVTETGVTVKRWASSLT